MSADFTILNWNVRGLNTPARREAVLGLIQAVNPTIVCLQESKLQHIDARLAAEFLGASFSQFAYLPADGTKGGIVFAWNPDYIEATDPIQKDFSLTMSMKQRMTNTSSSITTVYGPSQDSEKPRFLEELAEIRPAAGTPWLCVGDFNLIYEAKDKNNTNLNRRLMGSFRRALDAAELLEIALHNRKYTWSNERTNPTLVRLDRAFCSKEWDLLYNNFSLQALSSSISDHCPIYLSSQHRPVQAAKFKFENFWTRVPGFVETVQAAWAADVPGVSPMNILNYRLQNTATALRQWSNGLSEMPVCRCTLLMR